MVIRRRHRHHITFLQVCLREHPGAHSPTGGHAARDGRLSSSAVGNLCSAVVLFAVVLCAGGSSEGSEDWKRQLMEDSDDDAGTSQQQELHKPHSKGHASEGEPAVPLPVQQLRGQEQQQVRQQSAAGAPAAALVDQGGAQEQEAAAAGKKSLLGGLFRSRSGDTTAKRRFGFTFKS